MTSLFTKFILTPTALLISIAFSALLFSTPAFAQKHSEAYRVVDSLVRHALHFNADSAIQADAQKPAPINARDLVIPPSYPLLILNDKPATLDSLEKYSGNDLKKISIMKLPDSISIYGSCGVYGVIFITAYTREDLINQQQNIPLEH